LLRLEESKIRRNWTYFPGKPSEERVSFQPLLSKEGTLAIWNGDTVCGKRTLSLTTIQGRFQLVRRGLPSGWRGDSTSTSRNTNIYSHDECHVSVRKEGGISVFRGAFNPALFYFWGRTRRLGDAASRLKAQKKGFRFQNALLFESAL